LTFFEAIWHFFTSGWAFLVHLDLATLVDDSSFLSCKICSQEDGKHFLEIYLMPFKSTSQMHLTGTKSFVLCLASLEASNSKIVEKFSA